MNLVFNDLSETTENFRDIEVPIDFSKDPFACWLLDPA